MQIISGCIQAKKSKEALALLHEMQISKIEPDKVTLADAAVLGALFFACCAHGNVLIGERTTMKLHEIDPQDSGIYVLLASMYSEAKMWKQTRDARKMMKERGVEKIPGCSSLEINGIVHEFVVRDTSHPLSEWIYECLISLTKHLELLGFTSDVPT